VPRSSHAWKSARKEEEKDTSGFNYVILAENNRKGSCRGRPIKGEPEKGLPFSQIQSFPRECHRVSRRWREGCSGIEVEEVYSSDLTPEPALSVGGEKK